MSTLKIITVGGLITLIISWIMYYLMVPTIVIIPLKDAIAHEKKVETLVTSLKTYCSLNHSSFDVDIDALQNIGSSFTVTPSYIRVIFGEVPTNQGSPYNLLYRKMIFGFQFADANKQSLDGYIYDFDLANNNSPPYYNRISIQNYQSFRNAYIQPSATNSLMETMICTDKHFLFEEITPNTDTILVKYEEFEQFYNNRPASTSRIKFRMAAYDNFSVSWPRLIRWHRIDGYFVLNAYHANQNGNVILKNGEEVPYDLNDLCPPGNCN